MIRPECVVENISTIKETCFDGLSKSEKLLILSNLLLTEASDFLPEEIKKDATNILASGKRIVYEKLKFEGNVGLELGFKAHQIIDIAQKIDNGEINDE